MGIVSWIGDDKKRSKLKSLAAIGICDQSKQILNEFYPVAFGKKPYSSMVELLAGLNV